MREEMIFQILRDSRYTVVLSGAGLMAESGYPLLRDGRESYEIEEKYGYSFEEIFSSAFYSARKELFFRFYKEVVLKASETPPGEGFYSLKALQDSGLVDSIITRRIADLEKRAGCRNVYDLKGSVFENSCPSCGRQYPAEYIAHAKGVPLCEHCLVALRPHVCLFGEMIDNRLMTEAAQEVEKAEVLLVLGANLNSPLCIQFLQYYTGSSLILVTDAEHYSDQRADIVIHERCDRFLSDMVSEYSKQNQN